MLPSSTRNVQPLTALEPAKIHNELIKLQHSRSSPPPRSVFFLWPRPSCFQDGLSRRKSGPSGAAFSSSNFIGRAINS